MIYAALWGGYWYVPVEMRGFVAGENGEGNMWMAIFVLPPFVVGGSLTALATLDLDFGSAFFHYSLYVIACVLLRLVMDLPAL